MQTAVIGHKDSDLPVILPMDADELDRWRKANPSRSYWCGLQLGGCGGELSDRRYTTKVCHFAHHPSAPVCHRKDNGESSADHLFIKRGLRSLLGKQGQRGTVETRNLGSGPGDAVDLHLPAARRKLRFQLSSLDYQSWRAANLALGDDLDEVDWLFGADGPLTEELLARNGYSLRFRLETVGGERRIHIGSRTDDEPAVRWVSLEDCRITQAGLLTSRTESVRASSRHPEPFAFPIEGGAVFALAPEASVPGDSPFATEGRRLAVADVRPLGSPVVRAVLSLPDDVETPLAQYVYRTAGPARLLVRDGADGWAVHLDGFVRLDANQAARTGLARALPEQPETKPVPAVRTTRQDPQRPPAPVMAPPVAAAGRPGQVRKGVTLTRDQAVVRVRELLRRAAPQGRKLLWPALAAQLGEPLVGMSERDRIDFLVEVDGPLWDTKPVLSVLLRDDSGLLPCLPAVLERLGVKGAGGLAADSSAVRAWAARERERAQALYAKPPRPVPDRLPFTQPARVLTKKQHRQVDASIRSIRHHKAKDDLTGAKVRSSTAEERQKVREASDRVERKMAVLGDAFPTSKQARRTLSRARLWLKFATPGAVIPPDPSKLAQQALRANSSDLLAELSRTAQEMMEVRARYW
ncbi:hypothetical protein ACFT8P_28975 [Streptomyces sp. NPDC057101]|uniref:hypothetical protein n=1 Tax=Streptomyces sp. NPDC057101 TaxID=3346020 RepID=UPI00362B1BDE